MLTLRHFGKTLAFAMALMLVSASTVVPSLSYAQRYADHLSNYGGDSAPMTALSGFAALYITPHAPMLPVVLSVPDDSDIDAVLPSSCAMDKTVLPTLVVHPTPDEPALIYVAQTTHPMGVDQPALRGPPRA